MVVVVFVGLAWSGPAEATNTGRGLPAMVLELAVAVVYDNICIKKLRINSSRREERY